MRAGCEISQSSTYADRQVSLGCDPAGAGSSGQAESSEKTFGSTADGSASGKGLTHRYPGLLGKLPQFLPGLRVVDAPAGNDHRTTSRSNQISGLTDTLAQSWPPLDTPNNWLEELRREVPGICLNILGQGNDGGAGLGRVGEYTHGLGEGCQELFRPGDSIEKTADWAKAIVHAYICANGVFDLLEDWALVPGCIVVRREEQNGKAIHRRQSRSRNHVGRAWSN